jgi:hypothetical protein
MKIGALTMQMMLSQDVRSYSKCAAYAIVCWIDSALSSLEQRIENERSARSHAGGQARPFHNEEVPRTTGCVSWLWLPQKGFDRTAAQARIAPTHWSTEIYNDQRGALMRDQKFDDAVHKMSTTRQNSRSD